MLAVDPSSSVTGGSILGDKTRMEELSRAPQAFIRPSPAGGSLGGVAARTREALLVCEAAGFDVIIVETVGVGQSETAVARMTDLLVLLQLPNAGDDLQAIKKGIVELADLIVDQQGRPRSAARAEAAHRRCGTRSRSCARLAHWQPPVLALSALDGEGIADVLARGRALPRHDAGAPASSPPGAATRRGDWMWHLIDERLRADFRAHPGVRRAAAGDAGRRRRRAPDARDGR